MHCEERFLDFGGRCFPTRRTRHLMTVRKSSRGQKMFVPLLGKEQLNVCTQPEPASAAENEKCTLTKMPGKTEVRDTQPIH